MGGEVLARVRESAAEPSTPPRFVLRPARTRKLQVDLPRVALSALRPRTPRAGRRGRWRGAPSTLCLGARGAQGARGELAALSDARVPEAPRAGQCRRKHLSLERESFSKPHFCPHFPGRPFGSAGSTLSSPAGDWWSCTSPLGFGRRHSFSGGANVRTAERRRRRDSQTTVPATSPRGPWPRGSGTVSPGPCSRDSEARGQPPCVSGTHKATGQ